MRIGCSSWTGCRRGWGSRSVAMHRVVRRSIVELVPVARLMRCQCRSTGGARAHHEAMRCQCRSTDGARAPSRGGSVASAARRAELSPHHEAPRRACPPRPCFVAKAPRTTDGAVCRASPRDHGPVPMVARTEPGGDAARLDLVLGATGEGRPAQGHISPWQASHARMSHSPELQRLAWPKGSGRIA